MFLKYDVQVNIGILISKEYFMEVGIEKLFKISRNNELMDKLRLPLET